MFCSCSRGSARCDRDGGASDQQILNRTWCDISGCALLWPRHLAGGL